MTEIFKVIINGNEQGLVEFDSYAERTKYKNDIEKEYPNVKFIMVGRKENIIVQGKNLKQITFTASDSEFPVIENAELMIRNAGYLSKKDTRIVRIDKGILRDFQH